MPLTPAEKLQALSSTWVEWINSLQRKYVTEADGFNAHLDWNIKRGRDFDCLARLIYLLHNLPNLTMPGQERLHKWLKVCPEPRPSFKLHVNNILDTFVQLTSTPDLAMAFTDVRSDF